MGAEHFYNLRLMSNKQIMIRVHTIELSSKGDSDFYEPLTSYNAEHQPNKAEICTRLLKDTTKGHLLQHTISSLWLETIWQINWLNTELKKQCTIDGSCVVIKLRSNFKIEISCYVFNKKVAISLYPKCNVY